LVEEFVRAAEKRFPGVLIQFEDFAGPNAIRLLAKFRDRACCFNDDIQGTGGVALAAILVAERITGRKLSDERFVIAGAGGASTGIARTIVAAMVEAGLDAAAAREKIWPTDSRGLVVHPTSDEHKREFARSPFKTMPLLLFKACSSV
jgi:malate dehydrogenase (oxaloacetate-decarboxylating)(NADP+)